MQAVRVPHSTHSTLDGSPHVNKSYVYNVDSTLIMPFCMTSTSLTCLLLVCSHKLWTWHESQEQMRTKGKMVVHFPDCVAVWAERTNTGRLEAFENPTCRVCFGHAVSLYFRVTFVSTTLSCCLRLLFCVLDIACPPVWSYDYSDHWRMIGWQVQEGGASKHFWLLEQDLNLCETGLPSTATWLPKEFGKNYFMYLPRGYYRIFM